MKGLILVMVCWCAVVQGQQNYEKVDLKLPKYDGHHLNNAGDWLIGMGVSTVAAVGLSLVANSFQRTLINEVSGKPYTNPDYKLVRNIAIGVGAFTIVCPIVAGIQLKRHFNKGY